MPPPSKILCTTELSWWTLLGPVMFCSLFEMVKMLSCLWLWCFDLLGHCVTMSFCCRGMGDSDFSDEDKLPLSSFKETADETKKPIKKRVLVTRKIGLVKRRCKCTCKCPVCARSYPTQGELNRHYHCSHNKVSCSKCNMMFSTPSTLTRHLYTHAEPRFHCQCGKSYHFAAELCVHKLTHQ